jgi:hypothetical protein
MVLRGQYLERSVVLRSGEVALDALYHRGDRAPPCAIAAPHPALGGSMTVPVVAELAWALTRAGHPTLRFDYRGVGASQGVRREHGTTIGEVSEEAGDLLAAVDQLLLSTRADSACAVGYSFGAAVALAAARDARIERIVLVAPPTSLADFSALARLAKPALVACGEDDPLCDRDLLGRVAEHLVVIPGADHGFLRGLPELGKAIVAWLGGGPSLPVSEGAVGDGRREIELAPGDDSSLDLDE